MTAPRALLHLLAWFSPGFPTGGFAYSHGLEWAVEVGDVADEAGLRAWIEAILLHGAGRSDAILLRAAHAAAEDEGRLAAIAELARAAAPARERQMETVAQGTAFAAAAAPWGGSYAGAYPVAAGALMGREGIDAEHAVLAYLHAFAANLVSAAVRLIPLGQSAGLRVLAALEAAILAAAEETRGAPLDAIGGACFRSDIAAMRHETQYTRLFRS